jgi:Uncharacterized protein containing a NRPS condensation (elongation) domain
LKTEWNRLDNAAMMFPSAAYKTENNMFRFTCELNDDEDIDPDILQTALDETLESFDVFRCVLKRGIFWYYLENSDLRPVVKAEYKKLCDKIYDKKIKSLLFEVTYFRNRINLEVFHVLSDGTGSTHFLTMIVSRYLSIKYNLKVPPISYDASYNQMQEDSFHKYYTGKMKERIKQRPMACQLRGTRYADNRLRIITGTMSVKKVVALSREKQATVTSYMAACLLNSIGEDITMKQRKKPVALCIPVNLRNYFPSQSARNFFTKFILEYDYLHDSNDFDEVLNKVLLDFKNKLTFDYLSDVLNWYTAAAHNPFAKIAPLFFKDIVLKAAYWKSKLQATATLSNVGVIKLPDELEKYIKNFSVASSSVNIQACICSYNDNLSVSFTTPFINSDIERRFFRMFTSNGIDVEITSNTEGLEAYGKNLR